MKINCLNFVSFTFTSSGFKAAFKNVKYFPNSKASLTFKAVANLLFVPTAFGYVKVSMSGSFKCFKLTFDGILDTLASFFALSNFLFIVIF